MPCTAPVAVKVINNLGQIVFSAHLPNSPSHFKNEIDLSALPKGIYQLVITVDGAQQVIRVIKM